ncbi:YdcF family protein [Phormidium sp. CLA17]|uniref:YdcF family protein n=1 Tax=Leptolyngbya sp. Cla-17 TaxID=2803751 RepID=UPI001492EC33|nr:YdcF family protein [Leptolyngbya sp. Cla-17]MBM0741213.1 YdcF family protein [Leptolyngbya sp. Cla-17]
MFLFLSKLLPLFLYPLGLACLLLLLALGLMFWRRSRLAMIPVGLALVILLVSSNGWVSIVLLKSLEFQHLPKGELPQADAIVVLGGATKPAFSPRPWVEVSEEGDRVLYGAKLYREGKAPRLILSGGRVDWQGNNDAPESADMVELMKTMGVPDSAMIQEPTSRTTRENAVNVKKIMGENGIRRILLVTSAIHMPRSLRIFQKLGIDAIPAPTDFLVSDSDLEALQASPQSLALSLLPESEQLRNITRALKEYVGMLIYWLRGWI